MCGDSQWEAVDGDCLGHPYLATEEGKGREEEGRGGGVNRGKLNLLLILSSE